MRSCGECTACCTVLEIEEVLNKPEWQTCHHVIKKGGGCGIYTDRPPPCVAFRCYWLQDPKGFLDLERMSKRRGKAIRFTHEDRPDRLGIMFSVQFLRRKTRMGKVVAANELWPGASTKPRARYIIRVLAEHSVVIIHNENRDMKLVGPTEELEEAKRIIQEGNPHAVVSLDRLGDW